VTSVDSFVRELFLNIRASHPVTIVYTEDQFDSIDVLKESINLIRPDTDKILYWSSTNGWTDITGQDDLASHIAQPIKIDLSPDQKKTVLRPIFSSPEELGAKKPIFIASLLSVKAKKDTIELLQELRDFDYIVRNGWNAPYRLIIIANKSFEIPEDYDNMFGVIRHENPTQDEIRTYFTKEFIDAYIAKTLVKVYTDDIQELIAEFKKLTDYVVNTLSGLSSRQVELTLQKALAHSASRKNLSTITGVDFDKFKSFLYKKKFDELGQDGALSMLKSIPMSKVGGFDNYKEWLDDRRFAFTQEARDKGVKRPKGALLVGPSGTGKSYIAQATAGFLEFPGIRLNIGSLFGSLVGSSEAKIRGVLAKIKALAPCVVYVDEIDKGFPSVHGGSQGDSGVSARVFGEILSFMQDAEEDVFWILTANRVEAIPPEMLRPGRIDAIWCISYPTAQERDEILRIHLEEVGYNIEREEITQKTNEFSSAELGHVVNEGILRAAKLNVPLTEQHLIDEAAKINPMSLGFKDQMDRMREWAAKYARQASKPQSEAPVKTRKKTTVDI
jgi:hypothetical protein